ncbi:hypothetical protein NHX12_024832 [Muraenolepis orangiensis]|uniref:LsmAD domain-containing protein n=1 Tax=Muraenolepis orangiensis TaxID=630683 RepID=A0A9Q0ISP1_9TELE|nr:hypothetical protein NHX12_024832 [Muraenolepis orangiensis]
MLKQQHQHHQPGPGGRKPAASNGTSPPAAAASSMSSPSSGPSGNRTPVGRGRTAVKPSFQSSATFEGVYNNARMLHFLTAVVGSTCDVRVKNGNMYEGIFKTLSTRCELAVDAVHKRPEGKGPPVALPRREEITDTMIFCPSDLITMTCKDVDLNFATRDSFTDTGISATRVNGEHKEKVLQRWDGGDSNGERDNYDLDKDSSNGWDASEMFRYNESKYGITSTYDSSLSMYTVPLERGSSEGFRQREARAARLANEIEASPQYRQRVNMENDEGKSEEDKFSAVLRDTGDRERGRDSPGATREGKYIPLPQRQREINREPINGVSSRTSPKAQRPPQSNRPVRSQNTHSQTTAARSPKSGPSHDPPFLDTSSVQMPAHKTTGPTPLFPVDAPPTVQQLSQIEELRKFGKEFRLQPSGGGSVPVSPASAGPPAPGDAAPPPAALGKTSPAPEPKATTTSPGPSNEDPEDATSPAIPAPARTPGAEDPGERTEGVADQVKKSTLNPNAKEFNPVKAQMTMSKPSTAPTPPRPTPPSTGPMYNGPYLSYVSQIHSVQPPQMFQYTMSTVNQGKYPRAKGPVVPGPRSDHGGSAPQMLQAAASAAGAPLVASHYPQSYLQYNPQQYGQQQVLQAMAPYPGQPMYSMLQGGARMISQGGAPHPQAMGPPGAAQFQTQGENPQVQQQGLYAPQGFSHHSGQGHQPQPSSTPNGNQPQPQHAAPSQGQNPQGGPQSLYHSGPMPAPTPSNMPPGHTSPQASYPMQGYSIHGHQGMAHSYPMGQITQVGHQGMAHSYPMGQITQVGHQGMAHSYPMGQITQVGHQGMAHSYPMGQITQVGHQGMAHSYPMGQITQVGHQGMAHSYPMGQITQVGHQGMAHSYPMGQITQVGHQGMAHSYPMGQITQVGHQGMAHSYPMGQITQVGHQGMAHSYPMGQITQVGHQGMAHSYPMGQITQPPSDTETPPPPSGAETQAPPPCSVFTTLPRRPSVSADCGKGRS